MASLHYLHLDKRQLSRRELCLMILSLSATYQANGQTKAETYVFKKDIEFGDLPKGMERRLPLTWLTSDIDKLLLEQPILILDGASLVVSPPSAGSSRSLALQRLELRNGGRIITNGVNLELFAKSIAVTGGGIISFTDSNRGIAGPASPGTGGASGLPAGTVALYGRVDPSDVLAVSLHGQNGQDGGAGLKGPTGAQGPRGSSGADHLFDCARGGGNGGDGSTGGAGSSGGSGGSGGKGGRLILRGDLPSQRQQIDFTADGGKRGVGGAGGPGGNGGAGGPGGGGTVYCRGGSAGRPGIQGPRGEAGPDGSIGESGSVVVD